MTLCTIISLFLIHGDFASNLHRRLLRRMVWRITAVADTLDARARLSVLLRRLVHSTGTALRTVDFPGNDDSQRPGWDGWVETNVGTPWIPEGKSGWEFGTIKKIGQKANKDFKKSLE